LSKRKYSASGATAIAGIIHLSLAPAVLAVNAGAGYFFIASGILQLIWIVLTLKGFQWAYYVGAIGSIALIALWIGTRFPNPITIDPIPITEAGIVAKLAEGVYAILGISLGRSDDD